MPLLTLLLPDLLEKAGVNVRTLPGWTEPHYSGRYKWREVNGNPAANMHHHTAGPKYTPNRDKANGYAGLSYQGSARLYQERYLERGYKPVFTIANAHPAPISSGAGDKQVWYDVHAGKEVTGRPGKDTPDWYGNTHWWNDEWVLDGVGSWVDAEVWEMMLVVAAVKNELFGWDRRNHFGHGHGTGRKIDLWDGEKSDTNRDGFDKTIAAFRDEMDGTPPVLPPIEPPTGEFIVQTLRKGDGFDSNKPHLNPHVMGLQGRLKGYGFDDDNSESKVDGIDGKYGSGTSAALKGYLASAGLPGDGTVCDEPVWRQLDK